MFQNHSNCLELFGISKKRDFTQPNGLDTTYRHPTENSQIRYKVSFMFSCLLCCFQQQTINTSLREVNEMNDEAVQKSHAEFISASIWKRFRNYLGLLFHTTQSLILFALQILFAMLRATSSFGLRPHILSQNNTQLFCSAEYKIRKFGMTLFWIIIFK